MKRILTTAMALAALGAMAAGAADAPAAQIQIEVNFVMFAPAEIEPLAQKEGAITADSLRDLWRRGKGSLLASPTVTTLSGQEATIKGAKEYIYPTEYTIFPASGTNEDGTGRTTAVRLQDHDGLTVAEPGAFETREAGALLTVLPELSADGSLINLTLTPQYVCDPNWKDYGVDVTSSNGTPRKVRMEIPFFYTYTATTSLSVHNGQTLLIGGGVRSQDGLNLVFMLVTARTIDISVKPAPTKE